MSSLGRKTPDVPDRRLSYVLHVYHQRYNPVTGGRRNEYVTYDYEGTQHNGLVTKNATSAFDQAMWVEARGKIFNTLGVWGIKRRGEDNLCYDYDLERTGVSLNYIFFDNDRKLESLTAKHNDAKLKRWQIRMAPYNEHEFLVEGRQKLYLGYYFRDVLMYFTEKDSPEKIIGHALVADKYGYTEHGGKYYLDLFCAKECGNALMKVYQAHCNDRPTMTYSNMKVLYFYHRHGFKIGKECSDNFTFNVGSLNRSYLVKDAEFSKEQNELGRLSIKHSLGLFDEQDFGTPHCCYQKCKRYSETSTTKEKEKIYEQYAKKLCFESIAIIYCPPKRKSPTRKSPRSAFFKTRAQLCRARS